MVLYPGMKLEYFRQHEWKEEWIEQAENMVHEEYIATYESADDGEKGTAGPITVNATKKVCVFDESIGIWPLTSISPA
jgi:hypothetical protein